IELLEIVIDGLTGSWRGFSYYQEFYGVLIGTFEVLALLVFISVTIFWIRRNIIKIRRFWNSGMTSCPINDAMSILYFEMVLMTFFLFMCATDIHFQLMNS